MPPLLPTPSVASRNHAVPAPRPKPIPTKRYFLFCHGAPSRSRALEKVHGGTGSYVWEVATMAASWATDKLVVELSSDVLEEAERRLQRVCEGASFMGQEIEAEEQEEAEVEEDDRRSRKMTGDRGA